MTSQYNLKTGEIVPVKSSSLTNFTTDNVVISGKFSNLPSLAGSYLYQDLFKSKSLNNLVQLIDTNNPIVDSCPKDLVVFIKEFLAVLRGFKVPDIHNKLQFTRTLRFCLACPKLMKKSDQGCQFLMPFTKVRAFYKAEKSIEFMFNDIIRCAFSFNNTRTYPVKVMFGADLADMSDLHKACYKATDLHFA